MSRYQHRLQRTVCKLAPCLAVCLPAAWADMVAAQPMPAASAHATASTPAPGSPDEAKALIGWEYLTTPQGNLIKPGLSCRVDGDGPVTDRGNDVPGWRAMTYDCDGRIIVAIGREWRDTAMSRIRVKVVDAVALPGATVGATLHHKPGLAIIGRGGDCELDGRQNPNLVATMRRVKREKLTWRNSLVAAWVVDIDHERIVPVPIKRVVCYQELDP